MFQKTSKMAPKWLPEPPRGPHEQGTQHGILILPPREPPKSPLEASGSGKSILSVPSGGAWAEKWSDFTLPEAPWEGPGEPPGRHFRSIFAARPAGTKKVRKIRMFLDIFDVAFMLFFVVLLRLPRCAGASAHLEKYWFSPGGYCKNRLSAIFARNQKTTELIIIFLKRQAENQSKKACR